MAQIQLKEQIAWLRRQKGLTQEALAQQLGVTNQTVSKWESGQCCPDIQLLPALADLFGVSVDELMGHTPSGSLDSLCLGLKSYFTNLPEGQSFEDAYRLAAQLHEIVMTDGYKKRLPWSEKNYAEENMTRWGLSACSEAPGNTLRSGNVLLFTRNDAYQSPKAAELRAIQAALKMLSDRKALKVFFALQDLTVRDPDLYVTADGIAAKAKLDIGETEEILSDLPVTVLEDGVTEKYRIEGSAAWLADVIRLVRL